MSSIERLRIQGIRSFGPDKNDEAVIKFSSPLTLILGQNGCGKTTIIEALKYACCGELPAGTDGGSGFVHDPKLANLNEVKGNIKLQCRDMKGNIQTVSRAVRVIQKFKKLEFKSIDASYTDVGKKETVSGKCADIDTMMCQALGTSQAVLTNVIFCHQEDSLWPLEKGKKVKEKFDAIFGITEYNKCLDYFRSMSKELDTRKTTIKKDVDCYSKFWEEAKEKRKKLEDLEGKANANRDNISQMEAQIGPITEEIREIVGKESNFAKFQATMTIKEGNRDTIVKGIKETEKDIREEFFGSKDALLDEIRTFENRIKETEGKIQKLNSEKKDLQAEEKRIQKEIQNKSVQMGALKTKEDQHRATIETRNSRLRSLGHELEVNVVSYSQLNDSTGEEVLREIQSKIQNRNTELRELQEEQKRLQNEIQSKIDSTREKRATLTQDIKSKEKMLDASRREIAKVQAEIAEVDKSGDKLATLENNLKKVEKELTEVTASLDPDQCKAIIEQANIDMERLENRSSELDREMKELQKIHTEKANISKLIERRNHYTEQEEKLLNKHRETLLSLMKSVPELGVKSRLESCINEWTEEIRSHDSSIDQLQRELSRLTEKKRNLDEQIKQKRKKVSQDETKIEECCGQEDIHTYYESIKKKLQSSTESKGLFVSHKIFYSQYLKKLQSEDHICPLCHREFTELTDYEEIIKDLTEKLNAVPEKVASSEAEIKKYSEAQEKAARFLQLGNDVKRMKEVEIPKLKAESDEIDKNIKEIESQIKNHEDSSKSPRSNRELARSILSDCVLLDQYREEVRKLKREIKNAEDNLPTIASTRTLEQSNEEQDRVKSDLKLSREKVNAEQRKLSTYNDRVASLQKRKGDLNAEQLKIVGGAQKRKSLTEKLEELDMSQALLQTEIDQARAQLQPIIKEFEETNKYLTEQQTKHGLLLDEKRKLIKNYEIKLDEVKTLQNTITDYAKKGGSKRLQDITEELELLRTQKENTERRQAAIDKELETNTNFRSTHQLQKFNLDANLKLREKKEELAKIEEEIKEMQGRVKVLNYDQLRLTREKLEEQKRGLDNTISRAKGGLQEVISRIKDLKIELNQPHYKDAEKSYRKSVIGLTVTSKSVEDLKLYEKAMDWAMIHFHKERMKMINSFIRELWRQIYRGNDIDYIEIKTDEGTSTSAGRRTYNYKVIQVKSGVEIDMPGRCSAGQKVLACLIIRMALAETFCKNCGVLALDEPTTNLDRENVDSLSDALADIVERRSSQRNFQLLVITHDEEFLRKLFRVEKVEHYLEVKRDARGRSQVIQREAFL